MAPHDKQRTPPAARQPHAALTDFIYSGQRHDCVPRALLLDTRLTPLERNAWQVIHLLTLDQSLGRTCYDDLQRYLSNAPGQQASRETVARALSLLRLTRWLTLVPRGRDARSGRLLGALYVLHEEPLTPAEAEDLDPSYPELLARSLGHGARAIRLAAAQVLKEISEDPRLDRTHWPTRLELLAERARDAAHDHSSRRESEPGLTDPVRIRANPGTDAEPGLQSPVRNRARPGSESEPSGDSGTRRPVRQPNPDRTVRTYTSSCISTVPPARDASPAEPDWPQALPLSPSDRQLAAQALSSLPPELRQAVLAEAAARCASGGIRQPSAYLMGLIRRAQRGEFHPWRAGKPAPKAPFEQPLPVSPSRRQPGDPVSAQVQACLEELRATAGYGVRR